MTQEKTRKSIYKPIEVVLNGEAYQSRKFTHHLNIGIAPLIKTIEANVPDDGDDLEVMNSKWDSYCKWAGIVFGVKKEALEETEFDEIEDAFLIVKTELMKRQGNRMEKHVEEIKSVTDKIEKVAEKTIDIETKTKEIEKNVKGPGKKE